MEKQTPLGNMTEKRNDYRLFNSPSSKDILVTPVKKALRAANKPTKKFLEKLKALNTAEGKENEQPDSEDYRHFS